MSATRTVLITGAGRGIGAATARVFAGEGYRVFLVSRTESELSAVARAIAGSGADVAFSVADVSSATAIEDAVTDCTAKLGAPGVLVHAAGVYGPIGTTWEIDAGEWWRAQEVNVLGTLNACRAVLPTMLERRAGRIITFSGGGATAPLPRFSAYAAAKAAVVRLAETLAEEVREFGVTVNAIAPGAVDTRLQDDVLRAGEAAGPLFERMRELRESGAGGVPAELPASLALFLASDRAAGVTGKLISAPHDGWSAWDDVEMQRLGASAWLTLRRLDPHTLESLQSSVRPALEGADA